MVVLLRIAGLYKANYHIAICTNDTGIFATDLSCELALAACSLALKLKKVMELAKVAINLLHFYHILSPLFPMVFNLLRGHDGSYTASKLDGTHLAPTICKPKWPALLGPGGDALRRVDATLKAKGGYSKY